MPRPKSAITLDATALRILREKDGHTKLSLAKAAGVAIGYLSDLENGKRPGNATVIAKLAAALNVPKSMLEARRVDDEQVPA